jgi:NADPH-dependent 2,4-dienoyl-CoA reductase/sulfur reductase-like enzyme
MSAVPRIVIVGAGPAGVRAAQALVEQGIRPVLVDEGRRDGGQIYRRQPEGFKRPYAKLYGVDADKAAALHRTFDALRERIEYLSGALAWNLSAGELHVVRDQQGLTVPFDAIIICAGATDRLMPVPGWQRAGCYSLGAAQIALKSQGCAIGTRTVFLGTGPLLYLAAAQYVQAGAAVAAVLDTSPPPSLGAGLSMLRARPALVWRGLNLMRSLRRAGVPLLRGVQPVAIDGNEQQGVTGLRVLDADGREQRFDADAVALGWHLRAEAQLADLARCEFAFEPLSRQWLPRIDEDGRSSVRGVLLAGDGVRILGAEGAEAAGRLAALAALNDLGHAAGAQAFAAEAPRLRQALQRMDRFRQAVAHAFPWPQALAAKLPDDAVLCRCEAVTVGEQRHCVKDFGSLEVNRAKAFSRVGMGRCQGRFCGDAAAAVVADAGGVVLEAVGRLRAQAPVKPLTMETREVQS